MNQLYGAGRYCKYLFNNKNNMIDLDALGLSFSNEQEIIVLTEAAKSQPGAKNIELAKDINTRLVVDKINVSDLPKNGFEIDKYINL